MSVQDFGLSKRRRDILAGLLEQISGVQTVWANEPLPQVSGDPRALITLSVRNIGTLDTWESFTVDTGTNTQTRLGGQNVASVQLLIESFDVEIYAHQIYSSLTTRIYRERFRDILHSANMAIGDDSSWQELPTSYDNRVISAGAGAIRLAFADMDPVTDTLDTWIEKINGSSTAPVVPYSGTGTW